MFDTESKMKGTKIERRKTTLAAYMLGAALLVLMSFCLASNSFANLPPDHGAGSSTQAVGQAFPDVPMHAESAGALFMVGLVAGMVSGITLFFVHLRRRERQLARFSHEDMLLDYWPPPTDAPSWPSPASTESRRDTETSDEMIEKSDPWERSVDWWKNPDDQ